MNLLVHFDENQQTTQTPTTHAAHLAQHGLKAAHLIQHGIISKKESVDGRAPAKRDEAGLASSAAPQQSAAVAVPDPPPRFQVGKKHHNQSHKQ